MREFTQEKDHINVKPAQKDSSQKLNRSNILRIIVKKRHLNVRFAKNVFDIQVLYGTT